MKILVINCGSSSLKYQLIDMTDERRNRKGSVRENWYRGFKLTHQPAGKDKYVVEKDMPTQPQQSRWLWMLFRMQSTA